MNPLRSAASVASLLLLTAWPLLADQPAGPSIHPRERYLLDRNWRFQLGHASDPDSDLGFGSWSLFAKTGEPAGPFSPKFNDSAWRSVDLPHDWAVELPFVNDSHESMMSHGYKPLGRDYPSTSIGWYRRRIVLPDGIAGRQVRLRFDGVYRDCQVWLNGHYMGRHLSGYTPFEFDITAYARTDGPNVLVVRVDATENDGWFYEGAGIYRHVWLEVTDPVHIPTDGVIVRSEVNGKSALIRTSAEVENGSEAPVVAEVRTTAFGPNGRRVGEAVRGRTAIPAGARATIEQRLTIDRPRLWSVDDPALHRLVTVIVVNGAIRDSVSTTFGVRTLRWDKDHGFFLNGKRVEIKGVCCHQDHAGVGSALPDRLQAYRIERLKEMGCNAYRTSHNPPTPELLEACDRLGMLVMDETRLLGASEEALDQFSTLIRRDRNHPSVIIWSIGNEEWFVHNTPVGERIAREMLALQRRLDPTRLATYAANNGTSYDGINKVVPVRGFNYMSIGSIDAYRAAHPEQPLLGSEESSALCTRGIYANDTVRGYVSDYDVNFPGWGATAERWWKFYAEREWLAGAFVWTGFDYRGEPTPYTWPCINSHFGIMDVCGFPKNNFFYYQSWWSDRDVLHLAPHWNWQGREGQLINVWCQSNADSVELSMNGKPIGWKPMPKNGHLEWEVAYAPGELRARGIRAGRVLTEVVQTTGAPVGVRIQPDRSVLSADGEDMSVVNVCAVDEEGRVVPTADGLLQFEISGPGRIIGVGNGDPSSHEPDKYIDGRYQRHLFNGWCQVIVQTTRAAGEIELRARGEGSAAGQITLKSAVVPIRDSLD